MIPRQCKIAILGKNFSSTIGCPVRCQKKSLVLAIWSRKRKMKIKFIRSRNITNSGYIDN